jgi:hypothetical protein
MQQNAYIYIWASCSIDIYSTEYKLGSTTAESRRLAAEKSMQDIQKSWEEVSIVNRRQKGNIYAMKGFLKRGARIVFCWRLAFRQAIPFIMYQDLDKTLALPVALLADFNQGPSGTEVVQSSWSRLSM